ncbi:uncharacterized protein [Neodiprion pinetum]|uniref:uncharacterized protein n=1 Tax=Neodiprion pinetum TaxID=441929 RepID=UPI001EDD6D5F|nr:uncharacterized protein LOC124219385 [Neodiprion pinetum]XP_046482806.1 uncharacterized protein LOC124219385 [Neodiprion pinetum]XP_046482808.1 uncharacterized protein LOC124219385 [Neodiprion pinetum]
MENERAADPKPRKRYKLFLDPEYQPHWVSTRTHSFWVADATVPPPETDVDASDQNSVGSGENMLLNTEDDTSHCVSDSNQSSAASSMEPDLSNDCCGNMSHEENDDVCVSDEEHLTDPDVENSDDSQSDDSHDSHDNLQNFDDSETSEKDEPHERVGREDGVNDDDIMFDQSVLSVSDVMEMVMAYCMRFSVSHEARKALVDMIQCLAGPRYENWSISKFQIKKKYEPPEDVMTYTFFCSSCKIPILGPITKREFENNSVTCEECLQLQNLTMQSPNRFIYIDLKYQFKQLLSSRKIRESLMENLITRDAALARAPPTVMTDIYDSELYRAAIGEYFQNADHVLTYNFNTDGMPIFNSSNRSSWPLLLIVNELPPHLRFKHVLLAGLWVGNKEPSPTMMNTFLQQFVSQANHLTERGLKLKNDMGRKTTFKIIPLCCVCDSVARPIVQCRLQYNGYRSCSWCYAHGNYVRGAVRYLFGEVDADGRTHESHKEDVENATRLRKPVNGVKGASILLQLLLFNMVWGFPFEYMHAILLGVIKLLWDIWTTPGSPIYLAPAIQNQINDRLMRMTPTHEIHRLPRKLSKRGKWKASEWQSWLLFYSLPCLDGLIPDAALEHLSLLVDSSFILLQNKISEADLNKCELNLTKFVAEFEILYGKEYVTFNVHSLLHVVKSVKSSGPLWTTSAFSFESTNYRLKQQVNGPKGVDDQIAMGYLNKNMFQWKLGENMELSEESQNYCKRLFAGRPHTSNCTITPDNVVLLGKPVVHDNGEVIYARCIFKNTPFHSARYRPNKKTNDSVVQLVTTDIVQITGFVLVDGRTYIDAQNIDVVVELHVPHIVRVRRSDEYRRIPMDDIQEKLLFLSVNNLTYICKSPCIID